MTDIYVTYRIAGSTQAAPEAQTVSVPVSTKPVEIPSLIRSLIRPHRDADPQDGYRGQSPNQVVIINMVKLSNLL